MNPLDRESEPEAQAPGEPRLISEPEPYLPLPAPPGPEAQVPAVPPVDEWAPRDTHKKEKEKDREKDKEKGKHGP